MKAWSAGSPRPVRVVLAAAAGAALLVAAFAAGRAGRPDVAASPGAAAGTSPWTAAGYAFGGMPADGRVPVAEGWYAAAFGEGTAASGLASAALGSGTAASGHASLAAGLESRAGGDYATALGARSAAGGYAATALGYGTSAAGHAATALGYATVADGDRSIALGSYASAGGRMGAFVYGDHSTTDVLTASRDGEFLVRASGGVTFRSSPDADGGVVLRPGSGSWSSAVDDADISNVEPVDGEAVLAGLAALPVGTWRFGAEADGPRHMGPRAGAFHRAFGLGADDGTITAVDADGVALAAARALTARTASLAAENEALRAALSALETRLSALEAGLSPSAEAAAVH